MTQAIDSAVSKTNPTFVVIGYGNSQAGDDAIGQTVIAQLRALHLPNVATYTVSQLTPELSGKLATADFVIFIDACRVRSTETIRVTPLEAFGCETTGSAIPAFGHSCHPASLLALTRSAYGHSPQAWWIKVPAVDFTTGHPLSKLALQGIDPTLQAIKQLINGTTEHSLSNTQSHHPGSDRLD